MLLSSPKARSITFFQDSFNRILSQQLTYDRSYTIYILQSFVSIQLSFGKHVDNLNYPCSGKRWMNALPDDKILDWSKLKEIADDILKCI